MTANGNRQGLGDIKITGSGSSGGGTFNQVKIMGDAEISSTADCGLFKCLGTAQVNGSLIAETASVNGTLNVRENLRGGLLKSQGGVSVSGDLQLKSISINGELAVGGNVSSDFVKINGGLRAASGQTEELLVRGVVEVPGMLNGELVEIKMYGPSRIGELVGAKITVKKGLEIPLFGKMTSHYDGGELSAESIEGDVVYLENTKAAVVRGRRVNIGSGCEIGLVEYTDEFKQDTAASVGRFVRLG
ncbi:cytoskeletal protein CcmA (bactofilin family) [Paenibacillus favisporus]|uniref:Cytoskeletal protein CcmA (Bactofilin family) n=1 Tax=Paenibacillus favisporus TaxID=221028 RepID=A0ABV2F8P4_9BACL